MSNAGGRTSIFISYAHKDSAWREEFERQLRAVHQFNVWTDVVGIEPGQYWQQQIDDALAKADAALLLISANSLHPDAYVCRYEFDVIRRRHRQGMHVFAVVVGACPWDSHEWLGAIQVLRGGAAPGPDEAPGTRGAEVLAAEVVAAIIKKLKAAPPARAVPHVAGSAPAADRAVRLVERVLAATHAPDAASALAAQVVDRVAQAAGVAPAAAFDAVRLFVERELLVAEEPFSSAALADLAPAAARGANDRSLTETIRRAIAARGAPIDVAVGSNFVMLAREREASWQAYFEALRDPDVGALPPEAIGTVARLDAQSGVVAPQYLLAGLMSRFDEDWKPILDVYSDSLPAHGAEQGGFASLQASQWNLWLVWGPSVPLCTCENWLGHYAFQYGYGDESNSLPLLQTSTAPGTSELDAFSRDVMAQGKGAGETRLRAALRWAPFVFGGATEAAATDGTADAPRPALADAQHALLCGDSHAHAEHSDGLLLELASVQPVAARPGYFTAYLWMMFLVATADETRGGPQLVGGAAYPRWPKGPADRVKVASAQLWQYLLPVFVHANIADPFALRTQRRMLIENAVATLRSVWETRSENFDAEDVEAGIRFHLVCASDYSGCGSDVRFPPNERLGDLLRARLAAEPDREFAASVVLPAAAADSDRPWALAGYFSSCHLGEMIADYFEHVARVANEKAREKARGR